MHLGGEPDLLFEEKADICISSLAYQCVYQRCFSLARRPPLPGVTLSLKHP